MSNTNPQLADFLKANPVNFWNNNKREDEVKHAHTFVPAAGLSDCKVVDKFRTLSNLHYDIYNNGGGNATRKGQEAAFGVGASRVRAYRSNPLMLEDALDKALTKLIAKYPLPAADSLSRLKKVLRERLKKQQDNDYDFIRGVL